MQLPPPVTKENKAIKLVFEAMTEGRPKFNALIDDVINHAEQATSEEAEDCGIDKDYISELSADYLLDGTELLTLFNEFVYRRAAERRSELKM